ncbi:MAG TPA: SufD family Fe-S cluster assembly protein, partial [Candidatus Methanoperedens sp.]|nr:SufD family Fe-S cluster assembly protein [Candidatus Methanoperedens sp.]
AREKPARYGPDLDLRSFHVDPRTVAAAQGQPLAGAVRDAALAVGIDLEAGGRAGSFVQRDQGLLARSVQERFAGQLELAWSADPAGRPPWAEALWWRLVDPGADKYTAAVALRPTGGYCLRALPGANVEEPVQACLLIAENALSQNLHNLVVVEEGAALHVITGCTVQRAAAGLHIGVSEFVVRRGASLTFTMIHRWGEGIDVRPRSAVLVEEGGTYVSNYVLFGAVRSLQMYPATTLRGAGARARFQAVLCGRGDSLIDIGSRVVHEGAGSSSETITRTIGADRSRTWARGQLVARTDRCRARLECRGMLVSPQAAIHAIPELEADGVPHAELSHEAAISPIAEEEVAYLTARGLGREEAVAAITRGFLNVDLPGLPPALERSVREALNATPAGSL